MAFNSLEHWSPMPRCAILLVLISFLQWTRQGLQLRSLNLANLKQQRFGSEMWVRRGVLFAQRFDKADKADSLWRALAVLVGLSISFVRGHRCPGLCFPKIHVENFQFCLEIFVVRLRGFSETRGFFSDFLVCESRCKGQSCQAWAYASRLLSSFRLQQNLGT